MIRDRETGFSGALPSSDAQSTALVWRVSPILHLMLAGCDWQDSDGLQVSVHEAASSCSGEAQGFAFLGLHTPELAQYPSWPPDTGRLDV